MRLTQSLYIISFFFILIGCQRIPLLNESSVEQFFREKYPYAKILNISEDEKNRQIDSRIFIVTYSTQKNPKKREIKIGFWLHGVSNKWVQVPPVPMDLDGEKKQIPEVENK